MKKVLFILFFILLGFTVALADIQSTGEGPTRDQALTAAMRHAVEQGVGAFVASNTTVVDVQVIEDKVLSHSKGYVTKYRIIKEGKTEEGFSITIDAEVDNKTLKNDIDALTILRNSNGNPRILVTYSRKSDGAKEIRNKNFIEEIYNGIVESLTDKQFRVVDKDAAEKFALQLTSTHEIDTATNKAAAFGLKYHAEYTLYYSVSGELKEGAVGRVVKLRIKAELIDNTRSQVITSKVVESSSSGQAIDNALERAARDGGRKIVNSMIEIIEKNWMDMQQNGSLYTIVIDGVDNPEDIANFTGMIEKFPLVNDAKEIESGGGKSIFETTYKGKRDQLDRDVIRAARELGWKLKLVRAEGSRSSWKKK